MHQRLVFLRKASCTRRRCLHDHYFCKFMHATEVYKGADGVGAGETHTLGTAAGTLYRYYVCLYLCYFRIKDTTDFKNIRSIAGAYVQYD